MTMAISNSLKKQIFRPKDAVVTSISNLVGKNGPDGRAYRCGRDWYRHQVCRHDTFSLVTVEHTSASELIGCTDQEDYLKINFWLSGKHTTVLDGFGQFEHDCPEVFITSGPPKMIKVDVMNRDTQTALVALCLLPEFFPCQMSLSVDELPDPLRTLMSGAGKSCSFRQFPLTPDLAAATRAILSAPYEVRSQPLYAYSKAVELMCLLINRMESDARRPAEPRKVPARYEGRLHDACELLNRHFAEEITLERVSKDVGLNRMTLTSGFRELFGTSVHDYLQRVRMQRAYELLEAQDIGSIKRVAEAVGYKHASNFSTAFHAYFGFPPQKLRRTQR